ncbi:ESA_00282 family adhesion-associated protein [Enterobacter sp. C2]|uniref:ESA_00282 family adhesion-associated protein n=1 Tax=Enterobacter sp. C2 TaxID=2870346 RepID=UPI001CA42A64|nr:RNA helicase [Enterobacter sp. C2]
MNTVFYSVIALLLLTGGVLLMMRGFDESSPEAEISPDYGPVPLTKEEGEDHFSMLMNAITPVWYWRINHEYIDFLHATIKRMNMADLNRTPGLFEAQRRCSDLNSAVYRYYDNIKKRCLNGEKVSHADLNVLNLRQCFREFSLEAYPALVALVWPEYQRPDVDPNQVTTFPVE